MSPGNFLTLPFKCVFQCMLIHVLSIRTVWTGINPSRMHFTCTNSNDSVSRCAFLRAYADSEDPNQTAQLRKLIRTFLLRICQRHVLAWRTLSISILAVEWELNFKHSWGVWKCECWKFQQNQCRICQQTGSFWREFNLVWSSWQMPYMFACYFSFNLGNVFYFQICSYFELWK